MNSIRNSGFEVRKNTDKMSYPLSWNPTDSEENETLALIGVVSHLGASGAGHYVAYLRNDPADEQSSWTFVNDHHVQLIDFETVTDNTFGGSSLDDDRREVATQLIYVN